MELINDIQLEVTQIIIKKNSLMNKRNVFKFKRVVFMANIESVGEDNYKVDSNYTACGLLLMKDGEWIKTKESFEEIKAIYCDWYNQRTVE